MSDSITIPGGANSSLSLNVSGMFTQTIVDAFATAVASAASAGTLVTNAVTAAGVPTLPAGSTGLLTIGTDAPAQMTIPSGYAFLADTVAAPVTVTGSDQAISLIAEFGDLTYVAGTGGGSVVANGSDNVFFGPTLSGGTYAISYAGGNNTAWGAGSNVIVTTGTGSNVIGLGAGSGLVVSGGSDTVAIDTGAATAMTQAADALTFGGVEGALMVNQAAGNTIVAGSGSDTIFGAEVASVGGSTYYLASYVSSNTTLVENIVSDTIVAGVGQASIWGGAGNDDIYSNGGQLLFVAGAGSTTLTGSAGSNIVFFGDISGNSFIAGAGNETIDAAVATGANAFLAGAGATDFIVDPQAAASFEFAAGMDGGFDTISGIGALDTLNLVGNSLQSSQALSTGTLLTLTDGTKIWLQGYTGAVNINAYP